MHRYTTQIALGALVALAAAGTPCLADETPAAQPAASTPTVLNVKVARDKETGQLRAMTAQEEAELNANAKPVAPTILEVRRPVTTTVIRPDGSMTGKLSMANMENLVLATTPDGRTVMRHDDSIASPAPAAATELPAE
jgi:hypothetical protein